MNHRLILTQFRNERQSTGGFLQALPNAKEEAEFVSRLTNGTLYAGTSATESVYKKLAGGFDIIHLAMHTLINNQNPVFSKMIFSCIRWQHQQ